MQRSNVLLIYVDQHRWDAIGVNGNVDVKTPNLDRLAGQGANFDHHFVQCPVCMPSRMSLLTGRYPSTLGIMRNGITLPTETLTLPRILHNYGYRSANIGKLHFLPHANRDHQAVHPSYGFDHLEISDEPGCYEDAYRAWVARKAPDQLDKISLGLPPAAKVWKDVSGVTDTIVHAPRLSGPKIGTFAARSDVTHAAFVAEQTMEFLQQNRSNPFLCVAGFFGPHEPWVVPQEFLDLYDPAKLSVPQFPQHLRGQLAAAGCSDGEIRTAMRGYYASISEIDHYVGVLLACLDELKLADNTIVIFTSDHGEYLGEHMLYGKGPPAEDCISRTPLIIRRPGIAGQTIHHIVEAVDVLPTLLHWLGIPQPPDLQGQYLPTETSMPARDSALCEYEGWKGLRTERFHYTVDATGEEMLFDLSDDPQEYRNLAGLDTYQQTLSDMRSKLIQRMLQCQYRRPADWVY